MKQIYGTVKVFSKTVNDWVYLRPTNIGDIKYSINSHDHDGWMICDGRSLNKIDYPFLYNLIGISFGGDVEVEGEEGGTFKLPDARGRVTGGIGKGKDNNNDDLTDRILGDSVGKEEHKLTIEEMPPHKHDLNDPGHSHDYENNASDASPAVSATTMDVANNAESPQKTTTSMTGITMDETGGGIEFDIMQPTLFIGNVFVFSKFVEINPGYHYNY